MMIAMKALLILAFATACRSDSMVMMVDPDMLPNSFLTGGTNDAGASACIDASLMHCQVSFNRYLNITDNADWTNPSILAHALNTYFLSGVPGLLTVCRARTQFFQCLGTSYNSCINRLYFLSKGYSQQAAYGYVQIMKELEFTCGGGLLQAVRHWGCILSVVNDQTNQNIFKACVDAFNSTVTQNPNAICDAAQKLCTCFRIPFIVACGGEVGWWECERVRIAFELGSQCQDLQCHISNHGKDEQAKELEQSSAGETKEAQLINVHAFPERLANEYERMANNVPISDEEMKLAGGQ